MKKSKHVVAASRFADAESMVACICGGTATLPTPEDVAAWFTKHRLDTGAGYGKPGVRETEDTLHWKGRGISIKPPTPRPVGTGKTGAELQRAYRQRHPERIREIQRAYRARKRAEAAA